MLGNSDNPCLAFFIHRSGIPLLIDLYCLVLVTDPGREVWALVFSVPVLLLFERLVARRAMSQPFWTLGVVFLAAPAAAFVSSLTMPEAKGLDILVTALGRASLVIDFEQRLEQLWTTEGTCALLLTFLFLWVLGFALSLIVASIALGDLRESMKESGWEALPERESVGSICRGDPWPQPTLAAWGHEWDSSPAELYYALDHLLSPPHAPLGSGINPESEVLQAVLAIRGRQLRTGELPKHYPLSREVGEYRLNSSGGAKIVLGEIDPTCRPGAVLEFVSVSASTRERGAKRGDEASDG